jgi:hypothetical protein
LDPGFGVTHAELPGSIPEALDRRDSCRCDE